MPDLRVSCAGLSLYLAIFAALITVAVGQQEECERKSASHCDALGKLSVDEPEPPQHAG